MINNNEWRLPTKDELNKMYKNLYCKGIGNFASEDYWSSSSESSSYYAWGQSFSNGDQLNYYKGGSLRVRVVRSFTSICSEDYIIGEETHEGYIFDIQENILFVCKREDERKTGYHISFGFTWDEVMERFKSDEKVTNTESSKTHNLKDGVIVTSKVEFVSNVMSVVLSISNETYHYYNVNNEYNSRQFSTKEECQADIDLLVSKL